MKEIDAQEVFTIAEREISGMAGLRTEFLCLSRGQLRKYLLSIGGYEALASIEDYYDEAIDDYKLPDEINGKKVFGTDDDWVVGGDLYLNINDDGIEFDSVNDDLVTWLENQHWNKLVDGGDKKPTTEIIIRTIEGFIKP